MREAGQAFCAFKTRARPAAAPPAAGASRSTPPRARIGEFLSAQGGCEPQLTSHAAANMRIGNDKLFLIKIISHCLPFIGYPRSLNALRCVNEAAAQN